MQIGGIQGGSANLASRPTSAAKATKSSPAYTDPADTNQDGFVSAGESLTYSLKHPKVGSLPKAANPVVPPAARSATVNPATQYTPKGNARNGASHPGFLDLKA